VLNLTVTERLDIDFAIGGCIEFIIAIVCFIFCYPLLEKDLVLVVGY